MVLNKTEVKEVCNHNETISKNGYITCLKCGLVLDKIYIQQYNLTIPYQYRTYSQYVGLGNMSGFIGNLGTYLGYNDNRKLKDYNGKLIRAGKQENFKRIKKINNYMKVKNKETEYRIFKILHTIGNLLGMNSDAKQYAGYLYSRILKQEKKVINNISLIAFCMYYACRVCKNNIPITLKEICNTFQKFGHRVNPKLVLRDGLKYNKYIEKKVIPKKSEYYISDLVSKIVYHSEMSKRLELKGINWSLEHLKILLEKQSFKILENISTLKRAGRNPYILAGSVIYLSSVILADNYDTKKFLTYEMFYNATKISDYSMRDVYNKFLKKMYKKR